MVTGHTALCGTHRPSETLLEQQQVLRETPTGSEGQNPEWHSGLCTHNSAD